MITTNTYKMIEREEDTFYTFQLLEGPYKDVKYQYGKVSIKEGPDQEYAMLNFTWTLIEGDESLYDDSNFKNYIGDILSETISESIESGNFKIGGNGDNSNSANNNTKESA